MIRNRFKRAFEERNICCLLFLNWREFKHSEWYNRIHKIKSRKGQETIHINRYQIVSWDRCLIIRDFLLIKWLTWGQM